MQNSAYFPKNPWFSRNPGREALIPAYSLLIPGIFQSGFRENLGLLGKLPEFCNPSGGDMYQVAKPHAARQTQGCEETEQHAGCCMVKGGGTKWS